MAHRSIAHHQRFPSIFEDRKNRQCVALQKNPTTERIIFPMARPVRYMQTFIVVQGTVRSTPAY